MPSTAGKSIVTVYSSDAEPSSAFCDALATRLGVSRSAVRLVSRRQMSAGTTDGIRSEMQQELRFYKRLVSVEVSVEA